MKQSEQINELAAALVAAQKAFSPAVKAKTNPAFKSKYVDLAGAIEAAQPALLENGIAVIQGTRGDVEHSSVTVTTRIVHVSGQWIEDELTLPAANRDRYDAQSVGSAITYARRYSYMGMLGFAPEDDDGNAAAEASKGRKPIRLIPKAHAEALRSELIRYHIPPDDVKRTLLKHGFTTCAEITEDKYGAVALEFQGMIDVVKEETTA